MKISYPLAAFVAAAFGLATDLSGAEIKGRVIHPQEGVVEVKANSALLPNPGDQAEIYFQIPGLSAVAHVASGRVSEIAGDSIQIRIDEAAGQIGSGQLVRIASDRPRTRASFSETRPRVPNDGSDTVLAPSEQARARSENRPRFDEPDPDARQPASGNGSDTVFVPPEDEPPTQTGSSPDSEPGTPAIRPWSGFAPGDRNGPCRQSRRGSEFPVPETDTVIIDPFAAPPFALPPEQEEFPSPNGRQSYGPVDPSQPMTANRSGFRYVPPQEGGYPSANSPRYSGQGSDPRRRPIANRSRTGAMPPGQNGFYSPDGSQQFGPARDFSQMPMPTNRSEFGLVPSGQEEPPSPALPPVGRPMPSSQQPTSANQSWKGSWLIDGQTGPVARRVPAGGLPAPATPSESFADPDGLDETTPRPR
jgi:hypothetical protein